MKRVIITIGFIIISSCRSARPVEVRGTTYWQDNACALVSFAEMDGKVGWRFCVERVVATDDDLLEFHVRWTGFGVFRMYIDKLSDAGNRNMYIVDEQGNRYDHAETRGAADEDARLDDNFPSAAGVFVFPAAAANATAFTFHDDDQRVVTEPIRLTPESSTDRERSLAQLVGVLEASSVTINVSWAGLFGSLDEKTTMSRDDDEFRLQRGDGEVVSSDIVAAFLATLAVAPILERDYEPTLIYTDDYPFVEIEITTSTGLVTFTSQSQGPGMVPWKVDVAGRSYVIPDDRPARALKILADDLDIQISVRDERPQYADGLTSTGDTELVDAARGGNADRIRALIAQGSDIDERSPYDGRTPLGAAAAAGDVETIAALGQAGADPDMPSAYGYTPLADAAAAGLIPTLTVLVRAGADLDVHGGPYRETPLMRAAENGHIEAVRLLVEEGASVHARSSYGGTALMRAVQNNYPNIVALLVDAGSDVNVAAEQSGTALMQASRPDIVTLLVEAGADVNATGGTGQTALIRLVQGGRLFKHSGATSRERAAVDVPGTVRALLDAGADPNATDADGRTALFYSAASHSVYGHAHVANLELIRLLLRRGADPLHRDDNGETIMELVVRDGQDGALRVLQEERPLHQGA